MLTGHAERDLVGRAIMLDVDSFLAKPVSVEILAKHIERSFKYRFVPLEPGEYGRVNIEGLSSHMTGAALKKPAASRAPDDEEMLEEEPAEDAPSVSTPEKAASPAQRKPSLRAETASPIIDEPESQKAKPTGPAKKMALDDVPHNAVLARDVRGSRGNLLLAAGIPFRSNYVERLKELKDLAGDITHAWIYE